MRRFRPHPALAVALALMAATAALGQSPSVTALPAKAQQQYAKLEARAATEQGARQAETLAKLAEMDYAAANNGFAAGQATSATEALSRAREHSDQALALLQSEANHGNTSGMKNVEVSLEKISFGLRGLVQQVHTTERPSVEAAVRYFGDAREKLLQMMFAPKKGAS